MTPARIPATFHESGGTHDAIAALGYSFLIRAASRTDRGYLLHGMLAVACTQAFFGFANSALIAGWNPQVALVDIVFGLVAGAALGGVLKLLYRREPVAAAVPG